MKTLTKSAIAALALGLMTAAGGAFAADPTPVTPTPPYGPGNCPMAQQGGPGQMKGMGMMGMRGAGKQAMMAEQAKVDRNLTVDQVREFYTSRIKLHNNDRLKVGKVVEKDADTIAVEIVTVDNSLVNKFDLDRHTGWRK
jgi:hypothetical protein